MDDQTRITKLEAEMESIRERMMQLQRSIDLVHGDVEKLRAFVDAGFARQSEQIDELRDQLSAKVDGQRDYFEKKFADERKWAEENFRDIRASIERGFAESRADAAARAAESRADAAARAVEAKVARRWRIGLVVTAVLGLLGMLAKLLYGL